MQQVLTFRQELKFYVNKQQYYLMKQKLKHLMKNDKHSGNNGDYHIRSLYFDDIQNKALNEKLAGIRDRHKYRIRFYNHDDSFIQLEKKIKRDAYIAKRKSTVSRHEIEEILFGNYSIFNGKEDLLLQEMDTQLKNQLLRPKVIVDYVREAYTAATGNVRITFDKDLRTGLHDLNPFNKEIKMIPILDEDVYILEIKYDEYLPDYIKLALQMNGLRRQSASKYVMSRKLTKTSSWEDQ